MNATTFLPYLLGIACSFLSLSIKAQDAKITEEVRTLKTYPFSDPDPIPILTSNPKIYPYHKYEGYSSEAVDKEWKVVKLENDLVEVYVLPEVGGKVWGAIDKTTGEEFIYRNEVMKFRNISMRGPWTSGGIEFNFGIIGHHPSTATPVDYVMQEHPDGSVSCTVGNIDLPSRTQWRVQIILPKDKALFETKVHWYNPSPISQAYYNWMTAAAPAREDFEFYTPGDQYLTHPGEAKSWPYDAMGRDLSKYKENAFGPSKSYHVVGEFNDFFGGYYHDAGYGFGHWGEYEAIPGQKLWLWALSRSGGIWEDLLTDTDGQYIEFQAGRLFVQYSPGAHVNPVTQANFEAHGHDIWSELWFPVKELGGLSDVSEHAAMAVSVEKGMLNIALHPFQDSEANLSVLQNGNILKSQKLKLKAMEVFRQSFKLEGEDFEIKLPEWDLHYTRDPDDRLIERSFDSDKDRPVLNSVERLYRQGMEEMKYRNFSLAKEKFHKALELEGQHIGAHLAMAELNFRSASYKKALKHIQKVLKIDTYHPEANYLAGITYRAKGDKLNAKEAFGWAARSLAFRSNAYAQMAEIYLSEGKHKKTTSYAGKSLDFNRYNIHAWEVLAILARKEGNNELLKTSHQQIQDMDPLNHFLAFESFLNNPNEMARERFLKKHRSELRYQTFLELAINYWNKGQLEECKQLLALAPDHPMIHLWRAYLGVEGELEKLERTDPVLVFPYRRESLKALRWMNEQSTHWKSRYYLALNLWGLGRGEEAADLMEGIDARESRINFAPFYQSRAHILKEVRDKDAYVNLERAFEVGKEDWRNWRSLNLYLKQNKPADEALKMADRAHREFPNNYAVGMDYAEALINSGLYQQAIAQLKSLQVLPFEGASAGRRLYERAHHYAAWELLEKKGHKKAAKVAFEKAIKILLDSKQWPENLGVGKPFDPDERISDYLLGYAYESLGKEKEAKAHWEACAAYAMQHPERSNIHNLTSLVALRKLGKEKEAMQLLDNLLNSSHGKSLPTRWLAASFVGDDRKAKEISRVNSLFANSELVLFLEKITQL